MNRSPRASRDPQGRPTEQNSPPGVRVLPQAECSNRLLYTLQRLLAIPSAELDGALTQACDAVGDALRADKVDAFLYEPSRDSLVALGTNNTALSQLQRRLGLDVLQVSNGGRVVHVFQTGETTVSGQLQDDPDELLGVRMGLQIQSQIGVPLEVGGRRRGTLMIASQRPEFFSVADVEFTQAVSRWVGSVAHRAELAQELTRNAVEQGRRLIAEELVTMLAHDLRNYLSPIGTRLRLVQLRAQSGGRADDTRDAQTALDGVERISRMVDDILDVARLDQGAPILDLQPVELGALARGAAGPLASPGHLIAVQAIEPVLVRADPERARQCVDNLLANALEHSPHGAPVNVRVWSEPRGERAWGVLEIHNEGPGIPVELLPRLFERFAAGPSSRGLGLGLYLARSIAVAHGGELSAESPPGRGTRFRLGLPCYPDPASNPPPR